MPSASAGLVGGLALSFLSSSWLGVWAGLELNLMGFILMLVSSPLKAEEASVKYFLIQACGSSVLLMSGLSLNKLTLGLVLVLSLALLLKMGAAPFHYWFITMAASISWLQFLILSTLQKLGPLLVLSYSLSLNFLFILPISAALSSGAGAVGGLQMPCVRKLLAFSSVGHLGWILLPQMASNSVWSFYFLTYSLLLVSVVGLLNKSAVFHFNQISRGVSYHSGKLLLVGLLSLGGMPPLLGFFPKLIVIYQSSSEVAYSILAFLVLMSGVTLFYYLQLSLNAAYLFSSREDKSELLNSSKLLSGMGYVNLLGGLAALGFAGFCNQVA